MRSRVRGVGTVGGALRVGALALLFAGAGLAGLLAPLLNVQHSTTLACGLQAGPTMMANNLPSLLQPIHPDTPPPPTIGAFASDYLIGEPISFREDLTNVVGLTPNDHVTWHWDFGDGTSSDSSTPTHTYAKPGTYEVLATPTINGTPDDPDSSTIHLVSSLPAAPPVAVAKSTATIADGQTPVTFDAAGSHSADGSPLKYFWNFADGQTSTSPKVTHTFPPILGSGGTLAKSEVALIVTDAHGAKSVAYLNIEIVPGIPTAHLVAGTTSATTGDAISFDASGSTPASQPPGDTLSEYTWNFGDGSPQVTTQTPTISHSFQRVGTYTVTVQAIDQQGYPGVASVTVTVNPNRTPMVLGGIASLLVVVGGAFGIRAQRRRNALIRKRAAAMELARARAVNRQGSARQPAMTSRSADRYGGAPRGGRHGAGAPPRRPPPR